MQNYSNFKHNFLLLTASKKLDPITNGEKYFSCRKRSTFWDSFNKKYRPGVDETAEDELELVLPRLDGVDLGHRHCNGRHVVGLQQQVLLANL